MATAPNEATTSGMVTANGQCESVATAARAVTGARARSATAATGADRVPKATTNVPR